MPAIRLTVEAVEDIERLIVTHSLPPDTPQRVMRSLRALERFPRSGRKLDDPWGPVRVMIGPWPWLLMLYSYEEKDDIVIVLGFQDARSYEAVTSH
jgi:plasmid stabilization system protein ParE